MSITERIEKERRVHLANEFIRTIAGCGRQFFHHQGVVAHISRDSTGRIYIHDERTKKRIWIRAGCVWHGFNNGGTLQRLIELLAEYIKTGKQLPSAMGQHWGYGEDMPKVIAAGQELGVIEQ